MKKTLIRVVWLFFISAGLLMASNITSSDMIKKNDWKEKFVTHAELQDENGVAQNNFDIYDNMQAHWEYSIPAGTDIYAGDTMTVKIPSVLTIQSNVSFDIKDFGGNIIGKAIADHNTGEIVITFTEYAEKSSDKGISGTFNIWVHWDHSEVEQNTTVPIKWGTGVETIIGIHPGSGQPDPNEKLYKWGSVDTKDPTIIHWTVRVNLAEIDIQNAVLEDTLGPNQELVPSSIGGFHVASWDNDWNPVPGTIINPNIISVIDSKTFSINFGDLSDCVIINYDAKTTDGGESLRYKNSVSLTGDNIESNVVDVQTPTNGGSGTGESKITIQGTKTWMDNSNIEGLRPQFITINLYRNNIKIDSKKVSDKDKWKYSFENLDMYASDGSKYNYRVSEDSVKNYISKQDGYNFVNTLEGEIDIRGKKIWDDNNDEEGKRPDFIVVDLLANNSIIVSKKVTADNNWNYEFLKLPLYDEVGKKISYRIEEENVPDYTSKVHGFNITNSYIKKDVSYIPNTPNKKNNQGLVSKYNLKNNISTKKSLPSTGESNNMLLVSIGGIILIIICILIFKIKIINK
ncbi:Cna B-type domain-containing protein [Lactococcus garvieae]|uniref:Cna B-type domain-containing protein n=2 Tax=Lactococcus garvieae TaxID=1363 RepID=UPI000694A0A4|nr:Cna B-type domain-containing protein [Lactococcus garvieae]MDG6192014.1 Cna B-type domain-containing protein [Lactococcus garvieae]PCR99094.1 adhesin [Lactococcus garvieae]QPR48635.1 Cna B-type domain-containing protein [Lactococcus garvieae]